MQRMASLFTDIDVLLTPTYGNAALALTNLTGHPAVSIPTGFFPVEGHRERRSAHSILLTGPLWKDHLPLAAADAYLRDTGALPRPPVR